MNNGKQKKKPADFKALFLSILISEGIGIAGRLISMNDAYKYGNLNNPSFAPPPGIFTPVWILLYFLMGAAAYRVYHAGFCRDDVKDALFYYGSQLVFNFMWPVLFFRFCLRGVALLDLLVLLAFVIATTFKFFKIDRKAGLMMMPYIVWLIYAGILNYALWILNK